MQEALAEVFSPRGALAREMDNYRPRPAQLELAAAVSQTLAEQGVLVAEAGTGTGKTWAYLVPALLGAGKVLVSTGTRTLQDQLYWRDLPRLLRALALPASTALLKGRNNYVCHYHLDRLQGDERALKSRRAISASLRKRPPPATRPSWAAWPRMPTSGSGLRPHAKTVWGKIARR